MEEQVIVRLMMVSWLHKMDFKYKNCTVRKLRWRDEISPSNSRSFKELRVNNGLETSSLCNSHVEKTPFESHSK